MAKWIPGKGWPSNARPTQAVTPPIEFSLSAERMELLRHALDTRIHEAKEKHAEVDQHLQSVLEDM